MRVVLILAATVALLAVTPALALTEAQRECPARAAPSGFSQRIARAQLGTANQQELDTVNALYVKVADRCAQRTGVPPALRDAYRNYAVFRLIHDGAALELRAAKIPTTVIEQVMDVGPGRANPAMDSLSESQAGRIYAALLDNHVPTAAVKDGTWAMIRTYAVATSKMERALAGMH